MSVEIEEKLEKIPIIGWIANILKKIKLRAFEGLSLYDLIEMYFLGIVQGALSTRASAIAFSLFMALFPLLIFLITLVPYLVPYISLENFDTRFPEFLESFLPDSTSEYFTGIYEQIENQKSGGLLSSSFLISIFLMANGVNAIFGGFENSYHVNLTRNFFRQYLYSLGIGLILSILLIIGAAAFLYFEFYTAQFYREFMEKVYGVVLDNEDIFLLKIVQFVFFSVLSYFTTAILYYFGTREGKEAKFFSVGALMTTILFMLTSYLFGIYVEKFARYNELYGALGGLLILMVFIWLNSNILLLGFELNASLNSLRKTYNQGQENE
ncbi:YihY/virulence factor BrkB family protein [Maribacter halichondriae]|uniref:YihY/virulence factor BrkB family protein n=1 Tax=Maribacter halichondriae TaxID=2980554 RepID=UPI002358A82B|nr:YihY/virulence factor BrkB family protein [Maribacter sp. Hal144]